MGFERLPPLRASNPPPQSSTHCLPEQHAGHPVTAPPCVLGLSCVQHGALGTELLLRCDAPAGAARVEWRVNGTTVAAAEDAVGGDQAQLWLRNASLAQEGEYSCHHPGTGKTLRRIRLRVGCECAVPGLGSPGGGGAHRGRA
uniref:Ig-like domain-containing protein n=1 Tax=Chelydra serpentina TaxID=8475 RepID=A0A8C3SE31_CHESE